MSFHCHYCWKKDITSGYHTGFQTVYPGLLNFCNCFCSKECLDKFFKTPTIYGQHYVEHFYIDKLKKLSCEDTPEILKKYEKSLLGPPHVPEDILLQNAMNDMTADFILPRKPRKSRKRRR